MVEKAGTSQTSGFRVRDGPSNPRLEGLGFGVLGGQVTRKNHQRRVGRRALLYRVLKGGGFMGVSAKGTLGKLREP